MRATKNVMWMQAALLAVAVSAAFYITRLAQRQTPVTPPRIELARNELLLRQARNFHNAERWDEATEYYDQYLALNPRDFAVTREKAYALIGARRANEAAAALRTLVENDPNAAEALFHAACRLDNMGDYEAAADFFEEYLKYHPADVGAVTVYARMLIKADKVAAAAATVLKYAGRDSEAARPLYDEAYRLTLEPDAPETREKAIQLFTEYLSLASNDDAAVLFADLLARPAAAEMSPEETARRVMLLVARAALDDPSRAWPLLNAARAFVKQRKYDVADPFFRRYLALFPADEAISVEYANMLVDAGRLAAAATVLRPFLPRGEEAGKALLDGYLNARDFAAAEKLLEELIPAATGARALELQLSLARVRSWRGEYAQSIETARELLERDPGNEEGMKQLLDTLYWAREYADYLAESRKYLDRRPDAAETWARRVEVLLALRRPADAAVEARTCLERQPDDMAMRRKYANALNWSGRFEEAAAEFALLAERDPGDTASRFEQARALLSAGKADASLALLRGLLAERPEALELRLNYLWALPLAGRVEEADLERVRDWGKAARAAYAADPAPGRSYTLALAAALRVANELEAARELLASGLARNPADRGLQLALADALAALGDFTEASKLYELLLQETPRDNSN